MTPDSGEPGGSPPRIAYVLGTTTGGTGPHVAMLARGCVARGMAVRVFGPATTGRRYFTGPGQGGAAGPGEGRTAWPGETEPAGPGEDRTAWPGETGPAGPGEGRTAWPGETGAAGPGPGRAGPGESGASGPGEGRGAGPGETGAAVPGPGRAGPGESQAAGPGETGTAVPVPGQTGPGQTGPGRSGASGPGESQATGPGEGRGAGTGAAGPGRSAGAGKLAAAVPGEGGVPGFAVVDMTDRPRPAHDLIAVLRLRRLLRAWAPDVVHAHGLRAAAFAALALTGRPWPLVVTVHNAAPAAGPGRLVHGVLERFAARRSAAVTWVSGDLAARMRRAGAADAGRAVVAAPAAAAPGADQVAAARADLGAPGRPAVFAAGRLAAQKGFGVLIEAAARWRDRDPVPELAIAGTGPLAGALAGQARAAGVAVRFLGWRADIPALLAAADLIVVPSLWEGQPLIVQEALRAGRPLVASRAGGIPDLTGEDGAVLVPAGDAAALAAAIRSVLDDPGLAARLRVAATQRGTALPDATDAVEAAVALYRRVLRAAGGRTEQEIQKPPITPGNSH